MKPNSRKIIAILLFSTYYLLLMVNFALAGYEIETTIPTTQGTLLAEEGQEYDLITYIKYIYLFGISLVGVAALLSLVISGLMYMLSDTVVSKEDARKYIWGAISGLILALAAYLILYTINPNLIKLNPPQMPNSNTSTE